MRDGTTVQRQVLKAVVLSLLLGAAAAAAAGASGPGGPERGRRAAQSRRAPPRARTGCAGARLRPPGIGRARAWRALPASPMRFPYGGSPSLAVLGGDFAGGPSYATRR